jgi:hypothetical protein
MFSSFRVAHDPQRQKKPSNSEDAPSKGEVFVLYTCIFFLNPLLFASCTNTFSKCCEITTTTDMKRSAQ